MNYHARLSAQVSKGSFLPCSVLACFLLRFCITIYRVRDSCPFPKKFFITGGAGFIGSHLCERLVKDGNHVLCVDNYFTGVKDNITALIDNPRFEIMRHDVTFPLYVEVDEIYNLACPASPVHYQHDPVQTTKTSVHGAS